MTIEYRLQDLRWPSAIFLIGTVLTTLVGLPIFLYQFGSQINWWLHGSLFVGMFIASGLSITLGYHRLFSHLSFKAKWPVRLFTLIFGATAMENSALEWCSDHRRHHKHTDDDDDPYNIQKGFFHAHIGWVLFRPMGGDVPLTNVNDLKADPLVRWQHKWWGVIGIGFGFGLPALIGWLAEGGVGAAAGLLMGGVARQVMVHHMTFFINSLCHTLGSQPYSDRCSAKDSWFMALFTFGEGYHNFHHEFQHDYRNGVKPWQFDPTKWSIRVLEKLRLVSNLRRVPNETIAVAEIREKQRQLDEQLSAHKETICEKAQRLFNEAQDQLTTAHETWEKSKKEYARAMRQQLDTTKEQLSEMQQKMEQSVLELRKAIRDWHNAHQGLVLQLA
ncbi:MAG: fatty acid desaturase [Verrucomicrobiota bacterium]|nr:fatty acid desaturase [Verrucomicrobiota bacterium]